MTTTSKQHRQQGSLLVLCVIVLVIIALLGLATLQQVKMDSFSVKRHKREYVEQVTDQMIDHLTYVIGENGEAQIRDMAAYADYPMTNDDASDRVPVRGEYANRTAINTNPMLVPANAVYLNRQAEQRPAPLLSLTSGQRETANSRAAKGDHYLASTMPEIGFYGSSELDNIDSSDHIWPHLTNITGIWLDLPVYNPDPSLAVEYRRPFETAIDSDNYSGSPSTSRDNRDTNVDMEYLLDSRSADFMPRGADTDGDGIPDARWQWVPEGVRDIGGRKYVMALRIVDLNSLVNVNTGTILPLTSGNDYAITTSSTTASNIDYGYSPSSAVLNRLFLSAEEGLVATPHVSTDVSVRESEDAAESLMLRRFSFKDDDSKIQTSANISNGDFMGYESREDLWKSQASMYGNIGLNYSTLSEIELRRYGGLNVDETEAEIESKEANPHGTAVTTPTLGMANILRNNPYSYVLPESSIRYVQNVDSFSKWFTGVDYREESIASGITAGSRTALDDSYGLPGIRHMLTTASGASVVSRALGSTPEAQGTGPSGTVTAIGLNRQYKHDLREETQSFADMENIAHRVAQAFKHPITGAVSTPSMWYLGESDEVALDDIASQFALNVSDYADVDIQPEVLTAGAFISPSGGSPGIPTQTYYGIERLPYIREVYLQALYADTTAPNMKYQDTNSNGKPDSSEVFDSLDPRFTDPSSLVYYDRWQVQADSVSFAIELGNPFSQLIDGTNTTSASGSLNDGIEGNVRIVVEVNGGPAGAMIFDLDPADVGTTHNNNTTGTLAANSFYIRPRNDNNASDSLILVFNQSGALATLDADNNGADLVTDLNLPISGATESRIMVMNGTAQAHFPDLQATTLAAHNNITVSLEVLEEGTTDQWIEYDKITTNIELDATVNRHESKWLDLADTLGRRFAQLTASRYSEKAHFFWDNGNNVLTFEKRPDTAALPTPTVPPAPTAIDWSLFTNPTYTQYDTDVPAMENQSIDLSQDVKAGTSIPSSNPLDDNQFQLHCANDEIRSITELMLIPQFAGILGGAGTTHTPISERVTQINEGERFIVIDPQLNGRYPPNQTFVDISNSVYPVAGLGVPHAAIIMDQFTVNSPLNDGVDNDVDGTTDAAADPDEVFIPGLININTMPMHLLALSSPIPEDLRDIESLYRSIVAYRDAPLFQRFDRTGHFFDNPTLTGLRYDTIRNDIATSDFSISGRREITPGIASLGELLYINPNPTNSVLNMMFYGYDGSQENGTSDLDLNPFPINRSGSTQTTDSTEEILYRFQYLAQLYTIRSDRFAVYGIVRGYENDQFNQSPAEELRFIAILDRSNVFDATTTALGSPAPYLPPRVLEYTRID
ncbi:hypothetical protein [Poriferisphaera corsica]|nr:hypothetical protein [Poriferisphaera corsica]